MIKDKLIILKKISEGRTLTGIAAKYKIGKSTVHDIKKNQHKLQKFAFSMESFSVDTRKIMRLAEDEELDQALYLWFVQKRSQNIPVSISIN